MTISSERKEITVVVNRLLDNLSGMMSSQVGSSGYTLRRQIGDLRAFYFKYLADGTFTDKLLSCFTIARESGIALPRFVKVREYLFTEEPVGDISRVIVQAAIGFCLSAESRIIVTIEYERRDDVELAISVMKTAFDTAREMAADDIDSGGYQSLTYLAGALTNHLAANALKLPRTVRFNLKTTYPALALSQRVYYDASRSDELIAENRVINPAFCPRDITGLAT